MTTSIHFHSKSTEFDWLSNFSAHPITLENVRWPSVEHFYQAQKYLGTETASQIRYAETPLKARKFGQNRSLSPRSDWDLVKELVMRQAIEAKFSQNRQIRELLIATGDAELVHESSSDLFWGRSSDAIGDNRLGIIIMDVRNQLHEHQPKKSST